MRPVISECVPGRSKQAKGKGVLSGWAESAESLMISTNQITAGRFRRLEFNFDDSK